MVRTLSPSLAEVLELDVAIAIACMAQSPERLEYSPPDGLRVEDFAVPDYFRSTSGELVLSFDGGWYPFLDNTRGLNLGDQRWYLPKSSKLIAAVAHEMQTPLQKSFSPLPGGRTFLTSTGVVRRPQGKGTVEVLRWKFEKASVFVG